MTAAISGWPAPRRTLRSAIRLERVDFARPHTAHSGGGSFTVRLTAANVLAGVRTWTATRPTATKPTGAGRPHAGRSARRASLMASTATNQVVSMKQLLESGVHFGHQTRRWNPKMKRFIFTERNGIYIIDLQQSLSYIDRAYEFVKETVAHGGSVMFIGTKKQAQEAIAEQATRVGMPYVNQRWLGGMLTNFQTVAKRIQRMKELELIDFDDVAGSGITKKELLVLKREKDKLEKTLGGIRDMGRVPS